jgi:mono/diheme cytochrome c family protein
VRISGRHVLLASAACTAAAAFALSGCGTGGYSSGGNQASGKQLFVDRCGGCHTLAAAGTAGNVGPNLDDAFAQARADGMTEETFVNVTRDQILFPITNTSTGAPGMPGPESTLPTCDEVEGDAFCVDDREQAVDDIAAYVGSVAGTGVTAEKPTDGKSIFSSTCGGCHTLADAGTSGTVGPNLDQARPPKALVVDRVTNGQGAMPSFKDSLDPDQIQAVADYVSTAAGK